MKRFALALLASFALLAVAPAHSGFGLAGVGFHIAGAQAGMHPADAVSTIQMNTIEEAGLEFPDGQPKDLEVDLPEGFAGNPTAIPRCSTAEFTTETCPNATALGISAVKAEFDPIPVGAPAFFHVPVYNLIPPPGKAAELGFAVLGIPVTVDVGLRESPPYNVYAKLDNVSQIALFYASKLTIWGNPAAAVHDPYRGKCLEDQVPGSVDELISNGSCPSGAVEKPFLTAPRSCEGPLVTTVTAIAWNSGELAAKAAEDAPRTGCSKLGFAADTSALLSSTRAESPAGLSFELSINDEGLTNPDEDATAFSDIKRTEVTLPEGVTLNPSQAEGLLACTEAELAKETATSAFGAGCPAAAKVGEVEVESPLLEEKTLKGSLFLATPYQNPFGSLIAIYMVIKDPALGIAVKLPAKVAADPTTGRLRTTFGDPSAIDPAYRTLPQLPLSEVRVTLRSGARSPLVTPPLCGEYETEALFTTWAAPEDPYLATATTKITEGPGGAPCPTSKPFAPGFEAGTLNNAAGRFSPVLMRLTRKDGEQDLTRFDATLPPGVSGKIAGLGRCPDAAIAAAKGKSGTEEQILPSCPTSSEVGHVLAGAGVGSQLTFVPGRLYMAGPFAGAPLSIVSIVPAVAGPFDVGTVVTQVALDLDPATAQVKVDGSASDPIPHILAGIPLKLRELRIAADRPEFTLNPTSCEEEHAHATAFGSGADVFDPADDVAVPLEERFQAAGCASLPFKPKLKLTFKGGMGRSGHPAVKAVLTPRAGDANLAAITTLLPPTEFIDNAHINNPCTRVQFAEGACPPGSVLGTARAYTPLLDSPLEGPVYFRSNGGERKLPDIVADVSGEGLRFIQVGFVDSRKGRVRTRFLSFPDAPVSRVELSLFGGKRGLLENNRDLCQVKALRLKMTIDGHNGKRLEGQPKIGTSCPKGTQGGK